MPANIPHAYPIRMVDDIDHADENTCSATVIVPDDSPYVIDGELCPDMLIEIMAQCFAAGCGHHARGKKGYLAAVRDVRVISKVLAGDRLHVECSIIANIGSIWVMEGKIHKKDDGLAVASAELKIYIEEDR